MKIKFWNFEKLLKDEFHFLCLVKSDVIEQVDGVAGSIIQNIPAAFYL